MTLIPFSLLKLRDAIKKERTPETLLQLKNLIQNDIIGSINENLHAGNITPDDARRLRRLTHKLYDYLYAHYDEMEELNDMTDESLMLDIDIIEKQHQKDIDTIEKQHQKDISILKKQQQELSNALTEKDSILTQKEQEILQLKQQLEALQHQAQ